MSWMDSWSRPSKHAVAPPPLYLTEGDDVPYCKSCGRVMSTRKLQAKKGTEVKYCSDRCRNHRIGPIDKKIDQKILDLLTNKPESGIEKTEARSRTVKGDSRLLITCDEIEELVFGSRHDPLKVFGRRKNRASRAIGGKDDEWKSVDMEEQETSSSDDEAGGAHLMSHVRPPQTESEVNGAIGGEKGLQERQQESTADFEKRREGQRRAEEREAVRRAARRAVVFGFAPDPEEVQPVKGKSGRKSKAHRDDDEEASQEQKSEPPSRKCEAIMNGALVEPSFAKGNWSIRWREGVSAS